MTKVYQEYQKAADRHLKTCSELKKKIEDLSSNPQLNRKLLNKLRENLFYLTGYIIECSCCMLIYSNFENLSSKDNLVATRTGYCVDNISFDKPKKDDKTLLIKNHNHEMRSFQDIYRYLPSVPDNTPLIKGSLSAFERGDCKDLFFKWGAEVRYVVDITLTNNNVFAFYEIAKTINQNILNFLHSHNK